MSHHDGYTLDHTSYQSSWVGAICRLKVPAIHYSETINTGLVFGTQRSSKFSRCIFSSLFLEFKGMNKDTDCAATCSNL